MYGTWYKAHFIPEKLTVKMGNNGRQHPPQAYTFARPRVKLNLRLGGSGVASMLIPCKNVMHKILL